METEIEIVEVLDDVGNNNNRWIHKGMLTEERFWKFVDVKGITECWLWKGSTLWGYGQFNFNGKMMKSHRIAYILTYGKIPENAPFICHKCDNKPCCNPNHLYACTQQDNMHDRDIKKRQATGEQNGNAVLTDIEVKEIREICKNENPINVNELSKKYNVSTTEIYNIIKNKVRIDISYSPDKIIYSTENYVRGIKHHNSKVTWEIVRMIREESKNLKTSYRKMGKKYGISAVEVSNIVNNKVWKERIA